MYISAGFGLRPLLYFTFFFFFFFFLFLFCFFLLAESLPFILYSISIMTSCIVDDLWMDMLILIHCKPDTQCLPVLSSPKGNTYHDRRDIE